MDKKEGYRTTRRDFLKLITMAGAAGFSVAYAPKMDVFRIKKIVTKEFPETLEAIDEIIEYRKKFRLPGLPPEFLSGILTDTRWEEETTSIENKLRQDQSHYFERAKEIAYKCFGQNTSRLLKGVENTSMDPHAKFFNRANRYLTIGERLADSDGRFTISMGHEIVGHATDPLFGIYGNRDAHFYEPKTFVQVEHGKWRALSRAFSIKDRFFNDKGDLMFPYLQREVGKSFAQHYHDKGEYLSMVSGEGRRKIKGLLSEIAKRQETTVDSIIYNKRVCREIGKILIDLYLEKQVDIHNKPKKTYEDLMDGIEGVPVLSEIYAEMALYALFYPRTLDYDVEIMGGITEVLEAIKQKPVQLGAITKSLFISATKEDYELLNFSTQTTNDPIKSDPIRNEGDRPRKPKDLSSLNLAKQYTILCTLVVQRYPSLSSTYAQHLDESFDPEINMWDAQKVEWAIDSYYRSALTANTANNKNLKDLEKRVSVLNKFIDSSAF